MRYPPVQGSSIWAAPVTRVSARLYQAMSDWIVCMFAVSAPYIPGTHESEEYRQVAMNAASASALNQAPKLL